MTNVERDLSHRYIPCTKKLLEFNLDNHEEHSRDDKEYIKTFQGRLSKAQTDISQKDSNPIPTVQAPVVHELEIAGVPKPNQPSTSRSRNSQSSLVQGEITKRLPEKIEPDIKNATTM